MLPCQAMVAIISPQWSNLSCPTRPLNTSLQAAASRWSWKLVPLAGLSVPTCKRRLFLAKLQTTLLRLSFPSLKDVTGRKDPSFCKEVHK